MCKSCCGIKQNKNFELIIGFNNPLQKRIFWLVVLMRGIIGGIYADENNSVEGERQVMQ